MKIVTCVYCEIIFGKYPSQIKELNFCSRECFQQYKKEFDSKAVVVVCDFCGKSFSKKLSSIKRTSHNFCCKQCDYEFGTKAKNPDGYTLLGRNSESARAKISVANSKRRLSSDTRRKISEKHLGKKMTESTKIKISQSLQGRPVSLETRIKLSMAKRQDGVKFDSEDFKFSFPYRHEGGMLQHRLVMERAIGRKLKYEEVVHHIDLNPANNVISNLRLFPNNSEHIKFHRELDEVMTMLWG